MRKPRVQVARNTRTEIHADSRTNRRRTRTDDERAHIEEDLDDCDGTCRAGRYCIQHSGFAR